MKIRLRKQTGQSMVELSMTIGLVLILVLAMADLARIAYAWFVLNQAVTNSARYAELGGNDGSGRSASVRKKVKDEAEKYGIKSNDVHVKLIDKNNSDNAGDPLDYYTINADTSVDLLPIGFGNGKTKLTVSVNAVVQNEPFPV